MTQNRQKKKKNSRWGEREKNQKNRFYPFLLFKFHPHMFAFPKKRCDADLVAVARPTKSKSFASDDMHVVSAVPPGERRNESATAIRQGRVAGVNLWIKKKNKKK
jgi:hypothetical protein